MAKKKSHSIVIKDPAKENFVGTIDVLDILLHARKALPPAIQRFRNKTLYSRKNKHPGKEDG